MNLIAEFEAAPPGFAPEAIDSQLERLLASHHFCHSLRYPALLKYLVQQVQLGNASRLKERLLGIEVFHRAPDYDTNTDPVVRVTAAEVRKRIAQYYQEPEHLGELRIELPLGSYVPRFLAARRMEHSPAAESSAAARMPGPSISGFPDEAGRVDSVPALGPEVIPQSDTVTLPAEDPALALSRHIVGAPSELADTASAVSSDAAPDTVPGTGVFSRKSTNLFLALALLLGAGLATAGFLINGWVDAARTRGLHDLWAPMNGSSTPLLLIVGDHSLDDKGQSLGTTPNYQNMTDTVLTQMNHRSQVPLNDLISLDRIQAFLTRHNREYRDKGAGEANLGDLRGGPVVLFAGFDNRWTVQLSQHLRFRLLPNVNDSISTVVDAQNPSRQWSVDFEQSLDHFVSDYGIVARYFDPLLEQNVLLVAGIGEMGTAAASEFVTQERFAREIIQAAPAGWSNGNFEVVLNTPVVDGHPGPPRIIASTYW